MGPDPLGASRKSALVTGSHVFPDFYLVGAPKCGTTALYDFLGQHPEIFVPRTKELLLFATDLSYPTRLSHDEFLAHFSERQDERRVGTAHTAYLQSRRAAEEIYAHRPDADIIIMLRNPIDMLPSWHSELLYETVEDIEDFESALDAEPDRRQGRRIPPNARNSYVESLYYSQVAAYAQQVERYLNVFGRARVNAIVYDDFRDDPKRVYRETLEFLRVDQTFVPDFSIINANKVVKNRALQRLYYNSAAPGHRVITRLLPHSVRQTLLAMNVRHVSRPEISPKVKMRLELLFRDDIARLGGLIGRDLSGWIRWETS